jgi:hypothetical protein
MYTKGDLIEFGSYLLSEARTKRVEFENGHNAELRSKLLSVSEADFEAVWPIATHVLTEEDIKFNGPITDESGVELKAGDIVGVPTDPADLVDPQ